MGEMVTGGTMPLPAGFTESQCTFIYSIAETRASNSYSRSYYHIEQARTGRIVDNIFVWQNTNVIVNDGKVNYIVFAKTSNEMMGIQTGEVLDGQAIIFPDGTFLQKHAFVSVARLESTANSLGLKYFKCMLKTDNTVEMFGIREDQIAPIAGVANYVTIGVP